MGFLQNVTKPTHPSWMEFIGPETFLTLFFFFSFQKQNPRSSLANVPIKILLCVTYCLLAMVPFL